MPAWATVAALVTGVLLAWCLPAGGQGSGSEEGLTRFKAAFIYHFIGYVYWPEASEDGDFTIGILGDTPLEAPLRQISNTRRPGGRKLHVVSYDAIASAKECDLLFIAHEFADRMATIADSVAASGVLTVTDMPGLARKGAAINFVLMDGKLKFEVNRQALSRAGLRAGAQLLKLAVLVDEGDA